MNKHITIKIIVFLVMILTGCKQHHSPENKIITVTIPPLKGLVEAVVEDDYIVNVLLPEGATPETYSPTMSQITSLEESDMVFVTGTLPFERELINLNSKTHVINLSKGIELIDGGCNHNQSHSNHKHQHHGDPHIWISLEELSTIVDNIDAAIMGVHPDSTKYHTNSQALKAKIDRNLQQYKQLLTSTNRPKSILIYHPALGYIANTLGIKQISLENEGKSPTPSSLAIVINIVQNEGIETMLYQKEYPLDIVEPIANIVGVKLLQFNPLSENIIGEVDRVLNIILSDNEQ